MSYARHVSIDGPKRNDPLPTALSVVHLWSTSLTEIHLIKSLVQLLFDAKSELGIAVEADPGVYKNARRALDPWGFFTLRGVRAQPAVLPPAPNPAITGQPHPDPAPNVNPPVHPHPGPVHQGPLLRVQDIQYEQARRGRVLASLRTRQADVERHIQRA